MAFNVIDTSNLLDHIGSINILTVAGPLLALGPVPTMRTEIMVHREVNVTESVKKLLCGDIPTIASLLGSRPIQYWTNITTTWNHSNTVISDSHHHHRMVEMLRSQIILWKRLDLSTLRYDTNELARCFHGVYSGMHADESFAGRLS